MINLTIENVTTIGAGIVTIVLSYAYVKNIAEGNKRELEEIKEELKSACKNIRNIRLEIAKNSK